VIWLNPATLVALVALAAPILIHILVRRRAERFPFPTLRFLQPTRLAAIRRHVLEDVVLLAVRAAALAAAAAAVAGPLLVTPARRQAWERRIVRATVIDDALRKGAQPLPPRREASAFAEDSADRRRPGEEGQSGALGAAASAPAALHQEFPASPLFDGIRRAIAWLETAPAARRELVVMSSFPLGSITAADVAGVPADIGLRLERSGTVPSTRTVQAGRVWTSAGVVTRQVTLDGSRTSVREETTAEPLTWPIDVVSSPEYGSIADAAASAVLSQRVWAPPPDRRARLVLLEPASKAVVAHADAIADASAIDRPWMADAVAGMTRDADLRTAAERVAGGLDETRFARAPWQVVAAAADGRPLVVAAGSPTRLVVVCGAQASDVVTPVVMRAIANAIAQVPDLQSAEVVSISDALLQGWSRPATPPRVPRVGAVESDDRRWFWVAALCLLAFEMWIRRSRVSLSDREEREEAARVA